VYGILLAIYYFITKASLYTKLITLVHQPCFNLFGVFNLFHLFNLCIKFAKFIVFIVFKTPTMI